MKKGCLLVALLLLSVSAFAQYKSQPSRIGSWNDGVNWEGGFAPAQIIGGNANPDIIIQESSEISVDANGLDLDGLTLTVNDYLIIEGDLTLGNNAALVIGENGKLIVKGNFTSKNKVSINSGGLFVVGGTFTMEGADNQGEFANTGELYLNDPDANVKGDASGTEENFDALKEKYPDIFDYIVNGGPIPTPIELLYFTATPQQKTVILDWASSKAWDFSHYELERSADGISFDYLTTIEAEENTNWVVNYSYSDRQPLTGISYYRLKAVDIDGKFEYKGVEVVQLASEAAVNVYPNPSNRGFLHVQQQKAAGARVSLKDNSGRTVYMGTMEPSGKSIDTSSLQPGMYVLTVESTAGIQKKHVIIQ